MLTNTYKEHLEVYAADDEKKMKVFLKQEFQYQYLEYEIFLLSFVGDSGFTKVYFTSEGHWKIMGM